MQNAKRAESCRESLRGKRALVTGAGGFIGHHLAPALRSAGMEVIGLVRTAGSAAADVHHERVIDLTDRSGIADLVQQENPELVVHLARAARRTAGAGEFWSEYNDNVLISTNLLAACQGLGGLSRFVALGSCEEYGPIAAPYDESSREAPVTPYGLAKLAVTHLLRALAQGAGFPALILRPSVVYGPAQRPEMLLPTLISSLLRGEIYEMTPGDQTRDFLFVGDLIDAILLSLENPRAVGQVLNICSAVPIRVGDLAKKAADLVGPEAGRLLKIGALPYRSGEIMNYWANNTRAENTLGWKPRVSLEDGLRITVEEFRAVAK